MQEIHSQSERLSQQLNEVGSKALANMMAALVKLSNREQNKSKSLQVTREAPDVESVKVSRTNSPEATMDSGFKVTRKDANNPDLSPKQQAEQSIERLNSLLPDRKYFQRDLDVNGTKYNFEKYRGGAISIQSQDSKLYAKSGKIRFQGDESKLIKDLPEIVARVDRELDLERPKQINNRTEVLYGYDSNNNFIEKTLSQKDAQAILDLMNGKEGTTIKGGENLLIEYGGKKLFETDAQGVVIYSAYDRDPELLSSIKLKDEKGLTDLTNYAKRMAATPDVEAKVSKTDPKSELVPEPPQEVSKVSPQSPIGKTLDLAELTTDVDPKQASSVVYDRVLKSEFDRVKPKSYKSINIEGTTFKLNRQTTKGTRSIFVTPSEGNKPVQIGELDRDGNFKPDSKFNDPDVTKALDRVLAARGIDPRSVKAAQQLELAARSRSVAFGESQDPQYLPLTQENAPNPTPTIGNSPELATAGNALGVNTPKPKPKNRNNTSELATAGNAPDVSTSNSNPNIGNDSPELASTPANSLGVNVPTRGEKEAVQVPTSGGTPERSRPEPEVSQSR
ncbi:hypothetical protein [Chamaesiphon minutus]|uniref:DUF3945 domain-containing protein n=1 Tax=Chamaesiphon minutus (strain ATCC 27169 / PCC 6605) TaxID=1173020 RepID=K9UCM5_CHAP6|nr:hypothetical protein [Chamaesiphon minutus]AFY92585.1 hypothetical protein Cha6605_1408 [Chamaesiphon minutus PCC 6605]